MIAFKFNIGDKVSYLYIPNNWSQRSIGSKRGSGEITRRYIQDGKNIYVIDNKFIVFEDEMELIGNEQ